MSHGERQALQKSNAKVMEKLDLAIPKKKLRRSRQSGAYP